MKVCIITCLNERPRVSEIVLMCAERLGLPLFAGVHIQVDFDLVDRYNQHPIMTQNKYVGEKWNRVLQSAFEDDDYFTHFLIMGDDDSLSSDGYTWLTYACKGYEFLGFRKNGYYELSTGRAMSHTYSAPNRLIGAGRLVSRKAIERVCMKQEVTVKRQYREHAPGEGLFLTVDAAKYLSRRGQVVMNDDPIFTGPWDPRKKTGLDNDFEINMCLHGFAPVAIESETIHVTDFKSERNIWPYSILEDKCKVIQREDALWFLSEKEREHINTFMI